MTLSISDSTPKRLKNEQNDKSYQRKRGVEPAVKQILCLMN